MRNLIFLTSLLLVISISAQDFQGKATYKTHNKVDVKFGGANGQQPGNNKKIEEAMKKMFQKTYTLNFTKSASTYKQNEELEPAVQSGNVQVMMFGGTSGSDVLYKDVNKKNYVQKTEISGKRFLIKDELEEFGWEMTAETKKIGNYTCYKAVRKRDEERRSFTMTDGEQEETTKTVTIETIAWYTPEIPVSTGPDMYWGLPGLILEVHEGKRTIICSEIVLNPKEKIEIKVPKKGKKVSQEEFDKVMDAKTQEMIERFKNNRKSKENGNSISIEIQG